MYNNNRISFNIVIIFVSLLVPGQTAQIPLMVYQQLSDNSDPFTKIVLMHVAHSTTASSVYFNATTTANPMYLNEDIKNKTFGGKQNNIVEQGTVFSTQDPFPGHETEQIAMILQPRKDDSVYTGILTFTASKPVEIQIFHIYRIGNTTNIPLRYGQIMTVPFGVSKSMAISLINPNQSGSSSSSLPVPSSLSVPFTGNAIALHSLNKEPFIATYTLSAQIDQVKIVNNISGNASSALAGFSTKEAPQSLAKDFVSTGSYVLEMFLPLLRNATADTIVKLPLDNFSTDDLARILMSISPDVRVEVLYLISPDLLLKIKNEIPQDKLAEIFKNIPQDELEQILNRVPPS